MHVVTTWNAELAAVARAHLSAEDADAWISLLRPGIRLSRHDGSATPVAARLGGNPHLPPDVAWPVMADDSPFTLIASLDCAAIAAGGVLDIPFPADGTLLFFLREDAITFFEEDDTQACARVLHVPAGTPTEERSAPEGAETYPAVDLCATQAAGEPGWEHPRTLETFSAGEIVGMIDHPVNSVEFTDATGAASPTGPNHQVGGWAMPVQGPLECEIAIAALGGGRPSRDAIDAEAREWVLLAQFDTDDAANMMWGDVGTIYWMIRPEDLAARRFDRALFTLQCC